MLYISDVDLKFTDLDKPVSDPEPVPHRTLKVLMHMPTVFVGMAAIMGGVYWVIERRQKLMTEGEEAVVLEPEDTDTGESPPSTADDAATDENTNEKREG